MIIKTTTLQRFIVKWDRQGFLKLTWNNIIVALVRLLSIDSLI
jgi:hypothetical protein